MPKINAKTQELRLKEVRQYMIEGLYANTVVTQKQIQSKNLDLVKQCHF